MCFNPRPRAGGDQALLLTLHKGELFQSTPPRGGRPDTFLLDAYSRVSFNPRPRAGGDDVADTKPGE